MPHPRNLLNLTPRLVRLRRRLWRDGVWSTAKALFTLTCPRRYCVYRLAALLEPSSVAGIKLWFGLDDLFRYWAGNEDLPDEFYAEYKPGAHGCVLATSGAAPAGIIWILRGVRASRFLRLGLATQNFRAFMSCRPTAAGASPRHFTGAPPS